MGVGYLTSLYRALRFFGLVLLCSCQIIFFSDSTESQKLFKNLVKGFALKT